MYLVLCASEDRSARWAYEGLRKSGLQPVELITSDELAYGRWWEHRVGENTASLRLVLADGRIVSGGSTCGVLNRLLSAPKSLVNFAQKDDRDYAYQELTSFYLSWLQSLQGQVINRPEPQGFCGRWRHTSEWAILAQQAGLPAPPYRQSAAGGNSNRSHRQAIWTDPSEEDCLRLSPLCAACRQRFVGNFVVPECESGMDALQCQPVPGSDLGRPGTD